MATIGIHLAGQSGDSGMKLFLRDQGALLNAGGDTLTESATGSEYFTATVSESIDAGTTYQATVETSAGVAIYQGLLYSGQTIVDFPAASGDATAANQTSILAKLTSPTRIYVNPSSTNRIKLIRGNAYDDTSWNSPPWSVDAADNGTAFRFLVYKADDESTKYIDETGTVASAIAAPDLTNANTLAIPADVEVKFSMTLEYSATSHKTIAEGDCCVVNAGLSV